MAEKAPIGNNENELLMRCNIYFELLATEPDGENKITKENAADELVEPITEIADIKSFIKKSLRDCLLQLGEIASIKQNLEIKSLKELMDQNTNIIEGLKIQNPVKVEECTSDNIEECKQKLQQYKQQLQEMVSKAKTITEEKQAEVNNMNNENIAIKELSEKLENLDMENLDNIDLSDENLPQEEQDKVALIMDTLKQIKDGKAKQESSQKEINEQENKLKEEEDQAFQLQKQATEYEAQTVQAMKEEEKKGDDPEEKAIEQDLQEELNAAQDTELKKQLTGTGEVDVKAKTQAFDKTAEKVEGEGLVDTDAAMQEQLGKEKEDTPVVESDIKGVEDVGSLEDETKALEEAQKKQTDKQEEREDMVDELNSAFKDVLPNTPIVQSDDDKGGESGKTETNNPPESVVKKETPDNESKTGEGNDENRVGGRNKKSRKNRKSSKKKSKKNRK